MTPQHVCFVTFRETLGPIFSSVYVNPAAQLAARGHGVSILCLSSLGEFVKPALRRRFSRLRQETERRSGCRIRRLPTGSKPWDDTWWDRAVINVAATTVPELYRSHIVHAGGARATLLALTLRTRLPNTRVVYHVWGPEAAEYVFAAEERGAPSLEIQDRARRLHDAQARAMRGADLVVCISNAMKEWACQTFGIRPAKIVVIPCFCDASYGAAESAHRDRIRKLLGYDESDFVVAYSGSMLSWQLPAKALVVLRLLERHGVTLHFLGLTMHASSLHQRLREAGFPSDRTRVLSVEHREVARYLAAADLGILGRNLFAPSMLVNRVSSPIKFGEYLASGTPVVISEGIGDFAALTQSHRVGVVIPSSSDERSAVELLKQHIADYATNRMSVRGRCRRVARTHLDIGHWVGELASAYQQL